MKKAVLCAGFAAAAIVGFASGASAQVGWMKTVQIGYSKMTEDGAPGGSIGGHAGLYAAVHSVIGIGAEAGYHSLGSEEVAVVGGTQKTSASTLRFTGNVIARGVAGAVRPFAVGGLGVYPLRASTEGPLGDASDTESKFGFNLGGGLMFQPPTAPVGFGAEARWHSIMDGVVDSVTGEQSALDMLTIQAGIFF
jgi:opacity protein-like surface antigen